MNNSGTTLSTAITIEQTVRSAYQQTSPRHQFIARWKAATGAQRLLQAGGILSLIGLAVLWIAQPNNWVAFTGLLMLGAVLLASGSIGAERRIFGEHFRVYGSMLNARKGEPSKLRYLYFIDLIRNEEAIDGPRLQQLIPAIQAQIGYRNQFFRPYIVITVLSALIAMLAASGIGQPSVWSSSLGMQLLIVLCVAWATVWFFGREWRTLRPNREAKEQELLTFLHMAVIDLGEPTSPNAITTSQDIAKQS